MYRELEKLNVGDEVYVSFARYDPPEIRTIAKKTKTSITDSAGKRWTVTGSEWGRPHGGAHCRPVRPNDRADIEVCRREHAERQRRNHVQYYSWRDKPQSLIDAVHVVIAEYEKSIRRETVATKEK